MWIGVLMGLWGSGGGFNGFMGGRVRVLMGCLGVFLINRGVHRGFDGFEGLWVLRGFLKELKRPALNGHKIWNFR